MSWELQLITLEDTASVANTTRSVQYSFVRPPRDTQLLPGSVSQPCPLSGPSLMNRVPGARGNVDVGLCSVSMSSVITHLPGSPFYEQPLGHPTPAPPSLAGLGDTLARELPGTIPTRASSGVWEETKQGSPG